MNHIAAPTRYSWMNGDGKIINITLFSFYSVIMIYICTGTLLLLSL